MTLPSTEPTVINFHFAGRGMANAIRSVCAAIAEKEVAWVNSSEECTDMELLVYSAPEFLRQSLQAAAEKANCRLAASDSDSEFTIVSKDSNLASRAEGGAFVPTGAHYSSRLRAVCEAEDALAA
jgi:hypothetical protein